MEEAEGRKEIQESGVQGERERKFIKGGNDGGKRVVFFFISKVFLILIFIPSILFPSFPPFPYLLPSYVLLFIHFWSGECREGGAGGVNLVGGRLERIEKGEGLWWGPRQSVGKWRGACRGEGRGERKGTWHGDLIMVLS